MLYPSHGIADLIVHQLHSIPRSHRDHVLFPPAERDDTTGGDPSHQVHTKLRFDVPYPGLCFHLCAERQSHFSLSHAGC